MKCDWKSRVLLSSWITLLLPFVIGCGQTTQPKAHVYPIDGQLYFQKQPAEGAVVSFQKIDDSSDTSSVTCIVRKDGHFVPTQPDGAIGLPEGQYSLTATWIVDGTDRLAGKYSEPSKPLAKIKVEPTVNLLAPINLK